MAKAKLSLGSSFDKRVEKAVLKERRRTTMILNSDPDPVTKSHALASLQKATNLARKRISSEDHYKVLDIARFHKTVIAVETRRKDDADRNIKKLSVGNQADPNISVNLRLAKRVSKDARGKITESESRLSKITNDLVNTSSRSVQFGNKKVVFSP